MPFPLWENLCALSWTLWKNGEPITKKGWPAKADHPENLSNRCHIFLTKLKVPDIHVLLHSLFVHRFWDNGHASLVIPAKSGLGNALSI